jgi:hypothetical protein
MSFRTAGDAATASKEASAKVIVGATSVPGTFSITDGIGRVAKNSLPRFVE